VRDQGVEPRMPNGGAFTARCSAVEPVPQEPGGWLLAAFARAFLYTSSCLMDPETGPFTHVSRVSTPKRTTA
jgi:hypothetical protein